MSVKVTVQIEIDGGRPGQLSLALSEQPPGDSPVYNASVARDALLRIAERADLAIVGVYGDIGATGQAGYTPPLPPAAKWRGWQ